MQYGGAWWAQQRPRQKFSTNFRAAKWSHPRYPWGKYDTVLHMLRLLHAFRCGCFFYSRRLYVARDTHHNLCHTPRGGIQLRNLGGGYECIQIWSLGDPRLCSEYALLHVVEHIVNQACSTSQSLETFRSGQKADAGLRLISGKLQCH